MSVQDMVFPRSGGGQLSIGLEPAQMQATLQIVANLPTELQRQADAWKVPDRTFADALKIPYRPTVLETPPQGSYFPGCRLGVINMPWDRFPMVSVMSDTGTPTAESPRIDQGGSAYSVSLWIESIVRSDEFYADNADERVLEEGHVDRRAKRMLEALVQCIDLDRTLGGNVPELAAPRVAQTDPFLLPSSEAGQQTKNRVFSLVRVEYAIDTYPSHHDADQSTPDALLRGFGNP